MIRNTRHRNNSKRLHKRKAGVVSGLVVSLARPWAARR
jgi:hypothetical protein